MNGNKISWVYFVRTIFNPNGLKNTNVAGLRLDQPISTDTIIQRDLKEINPDALVQRMLLSLARAC